MGWNDRYSWLRKEKGNPLENPEVTFQRERIKELASDVEFYRMKASASSPIDDSGRKELEEKINSLKDRIVNLKIENAYLRGFIDGDPRNGVTTEKNFFS